MRPTPLLGTEVQDRLGLDTTYRGWIEGLAAVGPPVQPLRLPGAREAAACLRRLTCSTSDAVAVAACLPSPERTPEIWWLLERCTQQLVDDLGGIDYFISRWPSLPPSLGASGRLFYVHVFLAMLEEVRRWHDARGISPEVSWQTLSDLGRYMAFYRALHGEPGLAAQDWFTLHLRGALYQLGRLQFHRSRIVPGLVGAGPLFWYDRPTAERMGPGYRHGDPVLGLHIPATGPLTPDACDHALRWAREFFAGTFPSDRYRLVVCTSWLLDEQLAEYLPPTSNIVRFQRRFRLLPGWLNDDAGVLESVFRRLDLALDGLAPRTTLERSVVTHLRAGGHWGIRTGWFEL